MNEASGAIEGNEVRVVMTDLTLEVVWLTLARGVECPGFDLVDVQIRATRVAE